LKYKKHKSVRTDKTTGNIMSTFLDTELRYCEMTGCILRKRFKENVWGNSSKLKFGASDIIRN